MESGECKVCVSIIFTVHSVVDADDKKSVHSEINSIVESAFSNMLRSADDDVALDVDSNEKESGRWAAVSHSHPSVNERNLDERREGDPRLNVHKETQESADVDVAEQHKQDVKLKGDKTDDDLSWKQWKEQHRRMDLHKESFHETTGTSSPRISDETASHLHHRPPHTAADESVNDDDGFIRGRESVQDGGSLHEEVVTRSSAGAEDVLRRQPDLVGADSDVNEVRGVEGTSITTGSTDEVHDRGREDPAETDIPESPAVESTANANIADQNTGNEQLLKTEHDDSNELVPSGTTVADVESETKEGLLMLEEPAGKETFQEGGDRRVEDVPELAEILHKSSADEDEDKMQTFWKSEADTVDENIAADIRATTSTENDQSEDAASGSDVVNDEHPHNEDILPVDADISDSDAAAAADIVSDDGNTGWAFSPLGAIYSFIDAIIDMVRHSTSCMCYC